MINVTVLAMQTTMAFSVITPIDIFSHAGVMWNYFHGAAIDPHFQVNVVTTDGKPIKCLRGARIVPDGSIHDVGKSDLVVVSSIMNVEKTMLSQYEVVDWLKARYREGAHIATICSGAFLLAETGLLDGKTATTHWAFAEEFQKRYPQIKLKPERLITDEGSLFCSGGYSAGLDLSLYLVEKYCGYEVALQSSKSLIADRSRTSQAPYAVTRYRKDHGDDPILTVQTYIETHFDKSFTYDDLARQGGLSRRTLVRRFKAATGETPLAYQQHLRVETAKRLLENGAHSFDEITDRVGYADSSTFRRIFAKHTGLVPTKYRRQFRRIIN